MKRFRKTSKMRFCDPKQEILQHKNKIHDQKMKDYEKDIHHFDIIN